jgi:ankyrin repeat protein
MKRSVSLNLDDRLMDKSSLLFEYAKVGNLVALKRCAIQGHNLNIYNKLDQSLVHIAAIFGHLSIVKFLVYLSLDYNSKDKNGSTPLNLAIYNKNYDISNYLQKLIPQDDNYKLPIHLAAENGDLISLKYYLKSININIEDKFKNTPLHYAVINNKVDVVLLLIEHNADVNKKNIWNITPLEEAIYSKNDKIASILRKNNAYYIISSDSEQIILGDRTSYFEKLKIILSNLGLLFNNVILVQFFNTTNKNENLYCCSLNYSVSSIGNDLYEYTSRFIFEKNFKLFEKAGFTEFLCRNSNQNEFIFSPYCHLYRIEAYYILKFEFNQKLLGYFIIWIQKEFSLTNNLNKKVPKLFNGILNENYLDVLSLSSSIFIENLKMEKFQLYLNKLFENIKKKDSYHFWKPNMILVDLIENLEDDWTKLRDNISFKKIINLLIYQYNMNIPYLSSREIFNKNAKIIQNLLDKKIINNYKIDFNVEDSYLYKDLEIYDTKISNVLLRTHSEIPNIIHYFTNRDIYDIIGAHKYDNTLINYLNNLINIDFNFCDPKLLKTISENISGNNEFRTSNVIGIASGKSYCLFLHHEEINKAILLVKDCFEQIINPIKQIYYYYSAMVEYIHPFSDGNGRLFRVITNIMLRKIGIKEIINSEQKVLSFNEFCKLIKIN